MSKRKNARFEPMIILIIALVIFIGAAYYCLTQPEKDGENADKKVQQQYEEQVAQIKKENQAMKDAYEEDKQDYIDLVNGMKEPEVPVEVKSEGWDIVDMTGYPLTGTATVRRSDVMYNGLLLVNQWHSRPEDFDESMMLSINSYAREQETGLDSFWDGSSCKLHPVAIDALIEMLQAAKPLGFDRYVVQKDNNFRSYDEQLAMFNKELADQRSKRPNLSEEQLVERAKKKVNYPGTSEFNTGLSFCLYLYDGTDYYKKTPVFETEDGKWLLENAWRYGFVFRFPTSGFPTADTVDKTYKTGVGVKLKCFRYVGKGHAAVMNHLGLCLEEYIEYLQEHPYIAVYEDGVKKYEITYQYVGDDAASFTVNTNNRNRNYTMSLDNFGGVVTVYEY